MRVLVVEDDSQVAAYLLKGLKEQGHNVDHAADGCMGSLGSETFYPRASLERASLPLTSADIRVEFPTTTGTMHDLYILYRLSI